MNLVFDIGGMSLKVVVFDQEEIIYRNNFQYEINTDAKEILNQIIDEIIFVKNKFEIKNICISCPGKIDSASGEISGLSAIKSLNEYNFKKIIESKFEIDTFIDNDANCATIAEIKKGNAVNKKSGFAMIIGSGIGGAVFINGEIYNGWNGCSGDFGYMVDHISEGEVINFSSTASMNALEKNYLKACNSKKTGRDIFNLYSEDKVAKECIDEMIVTLAKYIINISVVLNPEIVLIGGAVSQNAFFINELKAKVKTLITKIGLPISIEIKECKYFNDSNLIGANNLVKD
jgi:predicted NBD/HSP70 family sugar kinase